MSESPQTTKGEARDAARYRWLRSQAKRTLWFWYDLDATERDEWIDTQMKEAERAER